MSVEITINYSGELRCEAVHGPSGVHICTDAPVDNCGRGENFSPTDLVATGLGACILTILGIQAEKYGLNLSGTQVTVEKHMSADTPRRIARLPVRVMIPNSFDERVRTVLERAAHTCPVHQSLHPEIEKPIDFQWAVDG
ncbi:MAG: OsmC family protein [Planctomycetes bacterium]|nr:OsmC family protein [Planctomycetota bacterium]